MVAALAPSPRTLPLLFPPDRPAYGAKRTMGWRWKRTYQLPILERRFQDDEQGAIVQWIVLRYYRDGVLRKALAAEYHYSERRVQEYLSGATGRGTRAHWWTAYSAPVTRALARLGFPVNEHSNGRKRADANIRALRAALNGAGDLLAHDARPAARRLRDDLALLMIEADDAADR